MKRCTRCTLPETIPGISFDSQGLCNFCQRYKAIQYSGEEELRKVLERAKGKRRKYDCIVPISGGRDSSYVLYLAKERYGLNPLAVNYDNEFRSTQALVNMETACRTLGVDFISLRSRRGLAKKIVSRSVRNAAKSSLRELATSFCDACVYGYHAATFLTAEKYKAPLIIWGSSKMEYTGFLTDDYFAGRKSLMQKIANQPRVLGLKFYRLLQRLEFPVPGNLSNTLRFSNPTLKNNDIEEVRIFDYIPWDQKAILDTITTKLGWRKPADSVTTWRTDCELETLVDYCFVNLFGCSKRCLGYHNMINEKQMTTAEALELERQISGEFTDKLRKLLEDIGLSKEEIDRIRSFRDVVIRDDGTPGATSGIRS